MSQHHPADFHFADTQSASIYWDTQDPACTGWAWKHADSSGNTESGAVDGDLPEDATLADVLHQACGSDLPLDLSDVSLWRPLEHDGPGWEVRS